MKSLSVVWVCLLFMVAGVFGGQAENTLYVGANYHPHDWQAERVAEDIRLMKEAGFNVVRMGHLAWDSYEPSEGKFEFEWFDRIMDQMHKAGIAVILDIPMRPAPMWLHHKHPSINIVNADGKMLYPETRYMEDMGDPYFQKYAVRFADKMSEHYAGHPALLAFGVDNESGSGQPTYSKTAQKRYIKWLKAKYGTVENLNQAWATQRWSRRINQWDEIEFPQGKPAPEVDLDLNRFRSDETIGYLKKAMDAIRHNAPDKLTTSNFWPFNPSFGFDYAKMQYNGYGLTNSGMGFYAGGWLNSQPIYVLRGLLHNQYESPNPFWNVEFECDTSTPGSIRKDAYICLFYGNQATIGWTWRTMYGGEEQFICLGMLDYDGVPSRKYDEYKQIAKEFTTIAKAGLPYKVKAETAIAQSFDSDRSSKYNQYYISSSHEGQQTETLTAFYRRNMDCQFVDLRYSKLPHKLLIVPGMLVMDEASANNIREYVKRGGTVIMTSNSAKLDVNGQVFTSTRPGRLADVFGIRVGASERTGNMKQIAPAGPGGDDLDIAMAGKTVRVSSNRFEVIEPKGATVVGQITSLHQTMPIITEHTYGKGKAIYVGLPAKTDLIGLLVDTYGDQVGLIKGPKVPANVLARQLNETHVLYFNQNDKEQTIDIDGKSGQSVLTGKEYTGSFTIAPYEPELIEFK